MCVYVCVCVCVCVCVHMFKLIPNLKGIRDFILYTTNLTDGAICPTKPAATDDVKHVYRTSHANSSYASMYSWGRGSTFYFWFLVHGMTTSLEICGNVSIRLLIGTWTWVANAPKQAYTSQTLFVLVLIPPFWSQTEGGRVKAHHYIG